MNDETLMLMNEIINILSKMTYNDYIPNFFFYKVDKDFVYNYIINVVLEGFSKEELKALKSKVFNAKDNYDMCGIIGKRISLPEVTNIISSIIIIHELTHYIAIKNKKKKFSYMSLYDEVIPINSEFKFLNEFYKEYIEKYKKFRFNNLILTAKKILDLSNNNKIEGIDEKNSKEAINKLSHIYSLLLLSQNPNYEENFNLFSEINNTINPLEYEFNKRGITLKHSIVNDLKKIYS